ncbi:MAG: hypothetical protein H0W65_05185 [Sphingomonas sp.]|uniref:hypothetical protein n=1 Tax=Sphingomonas sp. TaxID=28214 RepID=UPI0017FD488F|nr:hypothetical protein [Sphingomonas sp.]MBA3667097.1 hypothetical protein [Sphingomonas sp.]
MAILPPSVGPRAALADLFAFMRQRSREQVLGLIMAVLVTTIILIIFIVDAKVNTAPPPRVVYIESYGPDRTDADIIADQKEASERKHQAAEAKKAEFRKLEKQLGL